MTTLTDQTNKVFFSVHALKIFAIHPEKKFNDLLLNVF
jgi:hypothetical protein